MQQLDMSSPYDNLVDNEFLCHYENCAHEQPMAENALERLRSIIISACSVEDTIKLSKSLNIVSLLVGKENLEAKQAFIDKLDHDGRCPLHYAACFNCKIIYLKCVILNVLVAVACVTQLVYFGASINVQDTRK